MPETLNLDRLPRLILGMAQRYVSRKAADGVKGDSEDQRAEYVKKIEQVAHEAHGEASRRKGEDFVAFFTEEICSVPQKLSNEDLELLNRALHTETDHVRQTTILALNTVGWVPESSDTSSPT